MIRRILLACSLLTLMACHSTDEPRHEDLVTVQGDWTVNYADICDSASTPNPFMWSYPAGTHVAPTSVLPSHYVCDFYPDPPAPAVQHWGAGTVPPWLIHNCVSPVPAYNIALSWSSNTGSQPSTPDCVMVETQSNGTVDLVDFIWMAAMGWRTKSGTTEHYINSIEIGPHAALGISDLARVTTSSVDPPGNWICQNDSHCRVYENGAAFSMELDHNADITGIKPWSLWFSRGP